MTTNINHEVYQAIGNITIPVTTAEGHKISAYLSERAVAQIWLALRERGLDITFRQAQPADKPTPIGALDR